jgi:DNA mismatch repair protein MutS2
VNKLSGRWGDEDWGLGIGDRGTRGPWRGLGATGIGDKEDKGDKGDKEDKEDKEDKGDKGDKEDKEDKGDKGENKQLTTNN